MASGRRARHFGASIGSGGVCNGHLLLGRARTLSARVAYSTTARGTCSARFASSRSSMSDNSCESGVYGSVKHWPSGACARGVRA